MHPTPSLHYIVPLLAQRRRRHRRVRRLWGTGLLLGLGLLLGGGWVIRGLVPKATPPPAVVAPAVVPASPDGTTAPRVRSVAPPGEPPGLLAAGPRPSRACQTLSPGRAVCPPGVGGDVEEPPPLWAVTPPARPPGVPALTGQEPGTLARPRALANPTPSVRPVRATPPAPPVAAASCGTSSCPAAPAGRRPPPVPARLSAGRRLPALRPAGLRQPVPPVPPQGLAAAYGPPSLGEPERLLVSPPEPAPLLLGP